MQITVTGDEQVVVGLQRLKADIGDDLSEAFDDVGRELKQFFEGDVFESEGSAAGDKWAALTEPYATYKATRYPGKGILEATGAMRASFTSLVESDSLLFTNTADYAKYHTSLSGRPLFQVNTEVAALVGRTFQKHVMKAADRFNRG
jgi:phage gpG-like protein